MARNNNGLSAMENKAPASTRLAPSGGNRPNEEPSATRMNENSPICAKLADTVSAVLSGYRNASTRPAAATVLPSMMMATTASTCSGRSHKTAGLNSMPTDTKKSTANASRSGSDSCAARWLNSDSRITMPAKKAPSANDTPNSAAEPNAMPTAAATTHSVNSSRDPVRATCHNSQGNNLRPTSSISATNPPTCSSVHPRVRQSCAASRSAPEPPPSHPPSGGSSTSTSTMARSSTTSHPTAMRPV